MNPTPGVIRTPDQRIRVFISSTLKELAPERRVTRAAVERLHLAPVMFELGARPHPPRELYRAYLDQSDVFVGIYGESYGWVAPGEAVSGVEDEYILAAALPKLIYIRESATPRQERLNRLLDRVRDDDGASFKYFTTPQELRKLIEADLATLLAERFDQSRRPPPAEPAPPRVEVSPIPAPLTELIGRDRELEAVEKLLWRDSVRLVTLIGPGGIGKSRVAIAVARRERARGGRDVVFVDLTPVQDPALVPNLIAQSLGVLNTGDEAVLDKLKTALRDRNALIVIDNFEQVLPAAPMLIALLAGAPALNFLVTSRTLLRVSGEHAVELGPLELPGETGPPSEAVPASVALFVERARAVKPDFELNARNSEAVAAICVALDGVPLALELAAARIRMLTPQSMLARLDKRLALLAGGARDLPARQQTLRSTIEWSTQLLGPDEKRLLAKLGVFSGGFSLEAVEVVTSDGDGVDPVSALAVLVDSSLVRELGGDGQPYFSMLATVREYALEQLQESGALAGTCASHAAYFLGLAKSVEFDLETAGLRDAIERLNADRENLRAAARYFLDSGDYDAIAEFTWTLLVYWWVGGLLGEVRGWMEEVLASEGDRALSDRTRATVLYFTRSITLWHDSTASVAPGLAESVELFHRVGYRQGEGMALIFLGLAGLAEKPPDAEGATRALGTSLEVLRSVGDGWGEGMALVTLGRVALMRRKLHEAIGHFEASLALARGRRDDLGTAIALHHLGWAMMVKGDKPRARELFEESLSTAARLGHAEGVAYGLEGLTALAAAERDVDRAGRLLRASEALRKQTGLRAATRFSFHEHYLAPLLAGDHAEEFEMARTEGRDVSIAEAVKFALAGGQEPAGRFEFA